jgi:hypothetical protein
MPVANVPEPSQVPRDPRAMQHWFTQFRRFVLSINERATDDGSVTAHAALTEAHGSNGAVVGQTTLDAHTGATTGVHGATGAVVGLGDIANTGTRGVVLQGAAVADVAAADAATQTAAYVQADVQSIATAVNETKAQLNAALASLRAAGIITT